MDSVAFILLFLFGFINASDFVFPYNTEIKKWKFLHQEPEIKLSDVIATEPGDKYDIVRDLMKRVLNGTELLDQFKLELIEDANKNNNDNLPLFVPKSRDDHPFWSKQSSQSLDVIEMDNDGQYIILRGSSTIALAVAFNWYLQDVCNTTYDWRTYSLDLPSSPLPLPPYQQKRRSVPFMYYQNVCTVSYSLAFFDWPHWERHIDWMAMQGINMPLAFTGQEYVWAKTFAKFGLNTADLSSFFAGPAFYAWQRMGNFRGWGGPLRESEIMGQYNIQLQILARYASFEMTPALTCFAGHVPKAFSFLYPGADIQQSPEWNNFNSTYCCTDLLNVSDPLFKEVGRTFIEQQTKYYGTSHIYQCDTFNEMDPASNDSEYLRASSEYVYGAMSAGDDNAVWLMQGWLFHFSFWNADTVYAYLSGVPDDAMIILDLNSERSPVYDLYDSYYGKPFFFDTLHDYGGKNGLQGYLGGVMNNYVKSLQNSTVIGIGCTMEGIWQNYIIYDTTFQMGYRTEVIDLTELTTRYAHKRYGLGHTDGGNSTIVNALVKAWNTLGDTVYNQANGGQQPSGSVATTVPNLYRGGGTNWDPMIIQGVWQQFVSVGDRLENVEKFRYDLVDVTRQIFSDYSGLLYRNFTIAVNAGNVSDAEKWGNLFIDAMTDLDEILLTNEHWMLGTWIEMARNQAKGSPDEEDTANWYEFNARNQITLWGPIGQIANYACKEWGDLIGTYYIPQWRLFIDGILTEMYQGNTWDQNAFYAMNLELIEIPWGNTNGGYNKKPVGDSIKVACKLYKKWNLNGDSQCL